MVERTRLIPRKRNERLIPHPPMLTGESLEEFLRIYSALEDHIKPTNIVEELLVAEIMAPLWEALRLRRFKAFLIESARPRALAGLLARSLQVMDDDDAAKLSERFFSDDSARKEVLQILQKFNLDEGAIEAEAIRQVLDQLETADKMLLLAETRRERTLRLVAEYPEKFALRCKHASEFVLEHAASKQEDSGDGERPTNCGESQEREKELRPEDACG